MAIIKCKMCGGDMELSADKTFGTCEYCGSTMTLPKLDDDQRAAAFNRGNHFRRAGEFDKALSVYERIVAEDDTDAEAHWCCALCRFGIEYVEDPATYEYIPTCHRASFDSFLEDVDYLAALEHSDGITKRQYQKDAAKIADVQRGILATSQNEEPYDVFICYKETDDATKQRTRDSIDAQEIYYQLTQEGYRVFFSRITLEDVAGAQYEPYIFAALNSAKVMIVVGSKPEYFGAVWVKNEWSRFLALMRKDHGKLLLPCYKDMDPYDLPEQLSVLQSYDMTKIGFMQDLIRGVKKVLDSGKTQPAVVQQVAAPAADTGVAGNVQALLDRGFLALEDGEWESADGFFEQALNFDARLAEAYLGKLMAELKVRKREQLNDCEKPFDGSNNYQKALRFGDDALKTELKGYLAGVEKAAEERRIAEEKAAEDRLNRVKTRRKEILPVQNQIAAKFMHTVGLKVDGTVVAVGWTFSGQCDVSGWRGIVAISAGYDYTVGLKSDGTVVAVGNNYRGRCNVSSWRNIVAIAAGSFHTVGLKADGTVVAVGDNDDGQCNVSGWRNIVAIAAGISHTVGLKADGTVVATKYTGDQEYYYGRCDVSGWTDIVAIAAGNSHTVGLKADGTVVAVGKNDDGRCNVSGWRDIAAIAAGSFHTVGLKADGTVVAVGKNDHGQCDVSGWTDIVAIAAGESHTVGLKADGTVVATKYTGDQEFNFGQCDVSGWKLFGSIDTLEQEREAAKVKKKAKLEAEQSQLQAELPTLKGLFAGKRRKEIEARLAAIASELKTLG